MFVHKVIFRIDFERPIYAVADCSGTIMQLLTDVPGIEWQEFRNELNGGGVTGICKAVDSTRYVQIGIQASNINFTYEDSEGTHLKEIEDSKGYSDIFKCVQVLITQFKVSRLKRAGLRFLILSKEGDTAKVKRFFAKVMEDRFLGAVESELGEAQDYGIAINGMGADKLGFNFRAGPYAFQEAPNHFPMVKDCLDGDTTHSMLIDLDFYELNFELTIRAKKWGSAGLRKALKLTEKLGERVSQL